MERKAVKEDVVMIIKLKYIETNKKKGRGNLE